MPGSSMCREDLTLDFFSYSSSLDLIKLGCHLFVVRGEEPITNNKVSPVPMLVELASA